MEYSVLQICSAGRGVYLDFANYGESFPNYYQAKKFADTRNYVFGVVRSDRVDEVCRRYKEQNN